MNKPPETHVVVPHEELLKFVETAARKSGLRNGKARILSLMLTGNDLRGNFSHGTQQIAGYSRLLLEERLNSNPQIRVNKDTPCSAMVDGDGGLGYFPSTRAMDLAIEKAEKLGMAVTMSCNHGHFGAAGLYARMTLDHDLLSFVTSGHQLSLKPDQPLYNAGGGSPMAFSVPCGDTGGLILDFGTTHDLNSGDPHRDELARLAPGLVLRSIGLGEICQSWGGLLSGLSINPETPKWEYPGANQGGLFFVFRISLFRDPGSFKKDMDGYAERVRKLSPLPGFDGCFLPGGIEADRERKWRKSGVPIGPAHRKKLEQTAQNLGIPVPWNV